MPLLLLVLLFALPSTSLAAELAVFDFQHGLSEVAPATTPIDSTSRYTAAQGFGFTSTDGLSAQAMVDDPLMIVVGKSLYADTDVLATFPNSTADTADDVAGPMADLRQDAIASDAQIDFAVDLDDGWYDVTVWLGFMDGALYFMDVVAEDDIVAADVHAVTDVARQITNPLENGGTQRRSFTVEVADGQLNLSFGELNGEPGPWTETVTEKPFPEAKHDMDFDGEVYPAFSGVAVQGIRISTAATVPVRMEGGALVADGSDVGLSATVDAFNAGDYEAALESASAIPDDLAVSKALMLMWIAGRPEISEEEGLVEQIWSLADAAVTADSNDTVAQRLREEAWDIRVAYDRLALLGYGAMNASFRLQHGAALLSQFSADHPFYKKAVIRTARAWCGLDPQGHMGYWLAQQSLIGLGAEVEDNKYVKLFVDREWAEPDWVAPVPEFVFVNIKPGFGSTGGCATISVVQTTRRFSAVMVFVALLSALVRTRRRASDG
jgi:hypothetical protein